MERRDATDKSDDDTRELLEAMPLMRLVPLAGHAVSQRFGRIFGSQDGLTGSSAAVLAVLGFGGAGAANSGLFVAGRATHAELARRCMITPATLTGVVNTLVKAGYVQRERDETDRRVVWLVLTSSGWERVQRISSELRQFAAPLMRTFSHEEEVVVRRFLTQVILHYTGSEDCQPAKPDHDEPPGDGAPSGPDGEPTTSGESRHAA